MQLSNSGVKLYAPNPSDQSVDDEVIDYEARYAQYDETTMQTNHVSRLTMKKGASFYMRDNADTGYYLRVGPKEGNDDGMGGGPQGGGTLHGQ